MKYTMTVWIDFDGDTPEEALECAESIKEALRPTLNQHPTITEWDLEWNRAPEQEQPS